jgi:hypothetical protein
MLRDDIVITLTVRVKHLVASRPGQQVGRATPRFGGVGRPAPNESLGQGTSDSISCPHSFATHLMGLAVEWGQETVPVVVVGCVESSEHTIFVLHAGVFRGLDALYDYFTQQFRRQFVFQFCNSSQTLGS